MNKLISFLLPLLISTEVYTYNCPKRTENCHSGYNNFSFSDPKAPQCWTQSYNGWECKAKKYGKCTGYNNPIDIGNCKQAEPECPKPQDSCLVGYMTYHPNSYNVPKCWKESASSQSGWSCHGKNDAACDSSKGEVDVKKCNIEPPKPPTSTVPECPIDTEICKSNNIAHNANSIFAPKCWSKATSGWTCRGNTDTKCDASKGELDLKSCKIPPPVSTAPECPTKKDRCRRGYSSFSPIDPKAPACWSKSGSIWNCTNKNGASCAANQADLSICFAELLPKCPKADDECTDSDGVMYTLKGYGTPECWLKSNYGWKCRSAYGKCKTSEVDAKSC